MDDMNEIEIERWRPSEKKKSEEFILAVSDPDSENRPENFLPNEHKNSNTVLETDRPTLNNKTITPVILTATAVKTAKVTKQIRCGKLISLVRGQSCQLPLAIRQGRNPMHRCEARWSRRLM